MSIKLCCLIVILLTSCVQMEVFSELAWPYKDSSSSSLSFKGPAFNKSITVARPDNSLAGSSGSRDEDRELLRMLKGKAASELPELKSSFIEDDAGLLRASEYILDQPDALHRKYTMAEMGLMAVATMAQSMCYSWIFSHLYDNYSDMRLAAGPSVDQEQCISQLENLVARAELQVEEKYSSTDVNLYQLLDTWGHVPSGKLLGNVFAEGMYHECKRLKIELAGGKQAPTRYCSLSIRLKLWPKIDRRSVLGLQAGICIPKACDSAMYKNKKELLMRLLELQMRQVEQDQIVFNNLYCLPDEDSSLRSILSSPKATATLMLLTCWLCLLLYCTYMHDYKQLTSASPAAADSSDKTFAISDASAASAPGANKQQQSDAAARLEVYKMLSIRENLIGLFSTGRASSLMDINKTEPNGQKVAGDESEHKKSCDERETRRAAEASDQGDKIVNFRCIDGIKVIAMVYIVMGHVLMCLPTIMANGRELSGKTSLAFFLANLPPAFAVNAFLTITGTLTCYMALKQNQSHHFITSPTKWISFVAYRYLRIMPIYALVVLYCKTLAKYTGSGPLWDYATSSLSQRRACEQESWATTLLFKSNYASPLTLCIPGGWYLANDFQFFLVTPIFLALLYKSPRLGELALYLCAAAGYLAGVWSILSTDVSDTRPIATFAPHGFKTYVSHFSHNYTHPQYRIPAYLIGLLIGHKLFQFERAKVEFKSGLRGATQVARAREPDWSDGFKRYAIPASLLMVALCSVTPVIAFMLPFNKWTAHLAVATIMPLYHVLFAVAIGLYLLMATTGNGVPLLNSFLAASFWKPLARLSLCALLVNVEVINYIIQSNSNLHYISNQFHASLNCLCILATYLVSIVVCVLFEAPIRAVLNSLLKYAMKRFSTQVKTGHKTVKTC